jgi:hypothetical protein
MLAKIFGWLTGGLLDRVLDTVDRKVQSETDREKIKGEIIKRHYETRADWMRAGGFWLSMMFAVPLAIHFAAVVVYGFFWCADCAYPKEWTIAELPPPLDEWAWLIVVSIFGVIGADRWGRK